jgi:5-methylcytosine-specific restriction endonuclease McrA
MSTNAERCRKKYARIAADPERKAKWNANARRRAAANREKQRDSSMRWAKANPEKIREKSRRRRARLAGTDTSLTPAQWDAILAWHRSDEGCRCAYCFDVCAPTLDHVVPISRGGDHTADNVVPACKSCNSSKGTRSLEVFL